VKIGIITFHNANNYGAALQAVALKMVLSKFGEAQIINYTSADPSIVAYGIDENCDLTKQMLSYNMLSLLASGMVSQVFDPLKRIERFQNFIQAHGNLTEAYSYDDLINNQIEPFDIYVSGSDQIWNPKYSGLDPVFFSAYASPDAKKIAYASSIGDYQLKKEEVDKIRQYLTSFAYLSTREATTAQILQNITGKQVKHVLDPSLLLNERDWKNLFNIKQRYDSYVLTYTLSPCLDIFEIAANVAQKQGIRVINISKGDPTHISQTVVHRKFIDEFIFSAGPVEFLDLFYNARYIITDSFHGTIFAINFNKPFVTVIPQTDPGRITSILNLVDLRERLVSSKEQFSNLAMDIDYTKPNLFLEEQRRKSMHFLINSLN
jgi:Polysaccharide pyruvyl transferase.